MESTPSIDNKDEDLLKNGRGYVLGVLRMLEKNRKEEQPGGFKGLVQKIMPVHRDHYAELEAARAVTMIGLHIPQTLKEAGELVKRVESGEFDKVILEKAKVAAEERRKNEEREMSEKKAEDLEKFDPGI